MTMVEKVARALHPVVWQRFDASAELASELVQQSLERARAAIAAMSEPDEAMIDAFAAVMPSTNIFRKQRGSGKRCTPPPSIQRIKPMSDVLATDFIRKVAEVAASVGFMSGVGAMELAGQFISVLYVNPEHLDRFMAEGAELCIDGTLDAKNGCLTYMAINGKVTDPSVLRKHAGVQQ